MNKYLKPKRIEVFPEDIKVPNKSELIGVKDEVIASQKILAWILNYKQVEANNKGVSR